MTLTPGTIIQGKWSKERIVVDRRLGTGANGEVYLVRCGTRTAAMKVSPHSGDIALEWGILQKLATTGHVFPRPVLADDAPSLGPAYFYVMEWVPGRPFSEVFHGLTGAHQRTILCLIAEGLRQLHQTGHAFCDIKPENILIQTQPTLSVRFIDVGGVTAFGRSVRQFTPLYDRAFWGCGTRQAEPSYDVMAVALLVVCTRSKQTLKSLQKLAIPERKRWLRQTIDQFPDKLENSLLQSILAGQLNGADDLLQWLSQPSASPASAPRPVSPHPHRHRMDWTERMMWISLGAAFSVACLAWASVLGWT
jgi:serine/threonine protein kinase